MRNEPSASITPSRRQLLSTTAALAGVGALAKVAGAQEKRPAFGPVPKSAERKAVEEGQPIRMAMIGPGGMGNGHLDGIFSSVGRGEEQVEVVALAEVCKARLDRSLAKCKEKQPEVDVAGYRDYREMLARDDLHAVLVASPEHWHQQHIEDAVAAGLDVYTEKPMTLRLDQALRVREVQRANPERIIQVGTQYMMIPKYQEAKKLIAEGRIGHPTLSQTSYCRNSRGGEWLYGIEEIVQPGEQLDWDAWCGHLGPREFDTEIYHRWRRYRDFSTGIIGDLLVHMMTPLVMAIDAGWPVRVTGSGGHYIDKAMSNHDQVLLNVEFEKEHTMLVAGSTCNETGLETLIRGHEANLFLGGNDCVLRPERPYVDDVDEVTIQGRNGDWQNELRLDWFRSIRTREANRSPVEFATQIMVIVDLATRSLWDGRAWRFDPETLQAKPA